MTSQALPESGTTSFTYDSEDQLLTKTDARGITVTMTYGTSGGSIHQGVSRGYSDSTPAVSFGYNTQGLRTSMADGIGTVTYSYNANTDKLTQESRTLTGVTGTFTTGYAYNIKGDLTQMTYPSGRVVNLNYATGGGCCNSRLSSVVDQTTSVTIAGSLAYNAAGETTSLTLGNSVIETFGYNSRLQQTAITAVLGATTLMNFAYDYGTSTTNTGRVLSRTDSIQPEHGTKYAYDSIYRLSQVVSNDASTSWGISWTFDTWGNRLTQTPQGLATSKVGSQTLGYTNNRLTTNTYDAAGNQTNDGVHNYTVNAENQISQMDAGAAVYAYDGENRRMKKTVGSETTYYFYGITGLLCEFTTTNTGATQASAGDRATYRTSDSNGTAVLLISASGTVVENNRALPYGESWLSEVGSINNQKFTTYLRDGESGLDYAEARYFANNNGRFNSPDPAGPELEFPQSLNRYVYAMNDPINITDPTGKGFWGSLWKKIKSIFVPSPPQCGPGLGSPSCSPFSIGFVVFIPPRPTEEDDKCFADLKSRPVKDLPGYVPDSEHTFWWVQDRTGATYIISAGPVEVKSDNGQVITYLQVFVVSGNSNGDDHSGIATYWTTGASRANCDGVDRMLGAARTFPQRLIRYEPFPGPNSNSAARYVGLQGGFRASAPARAFGWSFPIVWP